MNLQGETFQGVGTIANGNSHTLPRLPKSLNRWFPDMVNKVKDGINIHPLFAGAVLTLLAAILISVRSEMNWQHDQIIILTTQKQEAKEQTAQDNTIKVIQILNTPFQKLFIF